jgi:hypothetical protein
MKDKTFKDAKTIEQNAMEQLLNKCTEGAF